MGAEARARRDAERRTFRGQDTAWSPLRRTISSAATITSQSPNAKRLNEPLPVVVASSQGDPENERVRHRKDCDQTPKSAQYLLDARR